MPTRLKASEAPTPTREPPDVPTGSAATVDVLALSDSNVTEPSPAEGVDAPMTGVTATLALFVISATLSEPITATANAPATPMPAPPAPEEAEAPNPSIQFKAAV